VRPVTLELEGFGSFRDRAVVDFTGADHFALVGPTGAGKSTVIDAITFALYGSVPRWDNQKVVSLALSSGANRGTVKLVFDVSGTRYVVARELRRAKGGNVTVKNVRLDQLEDNQGSGIESDVSRNLASDGSVTPAIEGLLGLTFDHFCTCVVLPQGEFAEFLHKKPGDREKLLRSLLGMDVYTDIMQSANSLAKASDAAADAKSDQAVKLEYATQEYVDKAVARATELADMRAEFEKSVRALRAADDNAAEQEESRLTLRKQHELLAAVRAPHDLHDLSARDQTTARSFAEKRQQFKAAEQADAAARKAQAAGPNAESLRAVRGLHMDRNTCDAAIPDASKAIAASTDRLQSAKTALLEAVAVEAASRETQATAGAERQKIAEMLKAAQDDLARLKHVASPTNLDDLAQQSTTASEAFDQRTDEQKKARAAVSTADEAVASFGQVPDLEHLVDAHEAYEASEQKLAELQAVHQGAVADQDRAEVAFHAAEGVVERLEKELQDAQRKDMAAALRPHLHVGDSCPVCAQSITTLPEHDEAGDVSPATTALEKAKRDREKTRGQEKAASNNVAATQRAVVSEQERQLGLASKRGDISRSEVEEQLGTARKLLSDAASCRERQAEAERSVTDAQTKLARVQAAIGSSAQTLQQSRDPLVAMGAPATTDDVVASWRSLVAWVEVRSPQQQEDVDKLKRTLEEAHRTEAVAARDLLDQKEALGGAREREGELALQEQSERTELERLTKHRAELSRKLEGLPNLEEVEQLLEVAAELARRAASASKVLDGARDERDKAEGDRAQLEEQVTASRGVLAGQRDGIVQLGAPPVNDKDLAEAWAGLLSWAEGAAKSKRVELEAADQATAGARGAAESATATLTHLLEAHEIVVAGDDSPDLAYGFASASAREKESQARRDYANREDLLAQIQSEREDAQVAQTVGNLLRTDAFPRWLIGSALDVLVADASHNLRELSGGQFDLTHHDGIFLVVDHTDAEAERPVKTLSGGETFQASLALALALSSHLAILAAAGNAHLESIFLDEGFGTLDDAMLDIVAETLESLASQGEQMVGLITHVKSLAERVPVRFQVTRDQLSSRIERVGG